MGTLSDLCAFLDMREDELLTYLPDGERLTKLLWDYLVGGHEPDKRYDPALVERYYRHPVVQAAYLLALTEYWLRPERQAALAHYTDLLAEYVPQGGYVLDWGAGTAEILLGLAEKRPDIHLVAADYPGLRDVYMFSRDGFQLRDDDEWRNGRVSLCSVPLDADFVEAWDKWDAVICTAALEHVVDIEATTRMLVSWINPGGVALFEVDWVYNRDFPMHLPVTANWRDRWATELLPSLGLRHVTSALWRKDADK